MDKHLSDLLTRYLSGRCTPAERDEVHRWYEKIGDNELELDNDEKEGLRARMLETIGNKSRPVETPSVRQGQVFMQRMLRVAAVVALIAVFGLWLFSGTDVFRAPANENLALTDDTILANETQGTRQYHLPDGSTVRLESFASIRYSKNVSAGSREVYLTGSAFFEIVKDTSRPFYVYSGDIGTRVLGTSFFVDAPADAPKVAVRVVTGTVSVFQIKDLQSREDTEAARSKNSTANGVVLSPNQKVEYYVDGGHWVTGLVEEPVPVKSIDAETLSFVFSRTPVAAVLKDIKERFGIEVITENENISRCTFTGDVSRMTLYDMLDVITNSIGSTYELKGTRILISGKGCDHASAHDTTSEN